MIKSQRLWDWKPRYCGERIKELVDTLSKPDTVGHQPRGTEMTNRRKELLAALALIQNHPIHQNHDIMTFTGFMNDAEVEAHIEANMAQVARWAEGS